VLTRWRTLVLVVASALAAAGCAAPGIVEPPSTHADAPGIPAATAATEATHAGAPTGDTALCAVLPERVVGELVGAPTVVARGDGSQCQWELRVPAPAAPGGAHLTAADAPALGGAFVDVGAFVAGRPPVDDPSVTSVTELGGVGDEAYVVRLDGAAPTTLYVRDGHRALSLWLDDVALTPAATEKSLARVATLVLRLA
jgi:hypothetical protein